MAAKFEVYQDKSGAYRWRLKSGNGNQIASSGEGYSTKDNCLNGIKSVQRDSPSAEVVDG